MHKFTIRVDREDQYRALLTDTSPYDTPIIFGNDEFYKSYKKFTGGDSAITEDVINCVFNGGGGAWKMPFVYKINKDNGGIRSISLVHPSSQINYANFYRSYEGLICHYCNKSPFTIRAPEKVGNKYYTGNYRKGLIKFRDNNVTTVFEDLISKYAKSYFAYKGYKRIFNFIDSREFINLERKFGNLVCADISKCFDTIYTHSLSWSVKNKRFSKKRSDFSSFPDDFDKVIRDSNYGETNGIPIGSEFSRIFSEILLQGVDMKIIKSLEGEGIFYGRDYSIRRYVDDFFIFSLTKDIEKNILDVVSQELSKYKLHINDKKTDFYSRPFFTKKSGVIHEVNKVLEVFFNDVITYSENDEKSRNLIPSNNIMGFRVTSKFIKEIKYICLKNDLNYGSVSSYILAAIFSRISYIVDDFHRKDNIGGVYYKIFFLMMIDISFHFYSVAPAVNSSFNMSKIIIISSRFFIKNFPSESGSIRQSIFEKGGSFLKGGNVFESSYLEDHASLEKINIFLAMSELGEDYLFPEEFLLRMFKNKISYFETIAIIYYIKDRLGYDSVRKLLEDRIEDMLKDFSEVKKDSKLAHLFLDVISCPHLSSEFRKKILRNFRRENKLPDLIPEQVKEELVGFLSGSWFVGWQGIDLLNTIEKNQLRSAY